jgi:hypothetical protein
MTRRPVRVLFTLGALACGPKPAPPTINPPEAPSPDTVPPIPPPVGNPSGPPPQPVEEVVPPPTNPPPAPLPTWEEVLSGHPAGATNPPIPELIVTPDGRCYKKWRSPMLAKPPFGDRLEDCKQDCGTLIACPPAAAPLLEKAGLAKP